jgi:GntR family transcriptional regulator, transcriptional repressor for pyruvate dehydrogenase complex
MMHNGSRPEKTAMITARRIVQDIDRMGLTTGDRLPPERDMLADYSVGRGTLREALRFLELQNVLSLKPGPGGGPMVEKPDASALANSILLLLQFDNAPFSQIMEARNGLEPLLARLAAERISDARLEELGASVDRMAGNIGDVLTFHETNKEFHDLVAWAAGNSLFGFLIDALVGIFDGTVVGVDYSERRRRAVLKAHMRVLEALRQRDGDASEEAMRDHIGEYLAYIGKKFPDVMKRSLTWDVAWQGPRRG